MSELTPQGVKPLRCFWWLCLGAGDTGRDDADGNDGDDRVGFRRDSEIHQWAQIAGLTVREVPPKEGEQIDLFAEPPQELLMIEEIEQLPEKELFPKSFGGEAPADALDWDKQGELEYGDAWAWDEEEVMFPCPRGLCVIDRKLWEEGHRHCAGC